VVDAIGSMLRDFCYKYSPFILSLFARARVEVNEGPEFTIGPTNGRSKSIKMNVRVDGRAYPRIKFEINGVIGLLIPSMRFCQHFKILHMAHLLISRVPTLLCPTKPFYLIPLHLMPLFSTFIMFPTSFLSRFLLGSLILGSPTYMKHKQSSTLH